MKSLVLSVSKHEETVRTCLLSFNKFSMTAGVEALILQRHYELVEGL